MSKFFFEDSLNIDSIRYGFFTRQGGRSLNNFDSLNCSSSSGDNVDLVNENINLALKSLNLQNKKIKFIKQTHSNNVTIIDDNNLNSIITADASITKKKDLVLAILTADCAPVFLFDKKSTFICSIHVGWKGCLNNIIKNTLDKIKTMDINNKDMIAIVGPCLAQKNFEVDYIFKRDFIQKDSKYKLRMRFTVHTFKLVFKFSAFLLLIAQVSCMVKSEELDNIKVVVLLPMVIVLPLPSSRISPFCSNTISTLS